MTTKTIHGDSQFQKPTSLLWTWESSGGEFHDEIDHIIVNRRFHLTLMLCRSFTLDQTIASKIFPLAHERKRWGVNVVDNIDEEYERLIQQLRDSTKNTEGCRTSKRRLSPETLKPIA
ncbi:hypothetical protein Y032_0145g2512 [Ancylostoma ceylanicum]|uniref:Uncharacterized protein n=1 Tax=Ancylostoma ceylanicum TaxID=53326 RepID=A0A016T2Q8_9BILA|nr:hypothetical protein Y032_0145g2512 [Ancylostoma ceylanicum]